jgi:hypothetical protein
MTQKPTIKTAEEKILDNIANPVHSHEVDGERLQIKDPLKQLQALDLLSKRRAARNPLGAIRSLHIPSGSGER